MREWRTLRPKRKLRLDQNCNQERVTQWLRAFFPVSGDDSVKEVVAWFVGSGFPNHGDGSSEEGRRVAV